MHHPTDRITHTTSFVTPVVEHWPILIYVIGPTNFHFWNFFVCFIYTVSHLFNNTVNLAYNVPVGTSVFCPLYTKSVLRVYRTLSVIRIYRTLSVIDINLTLSGLCIPYTVRYTRKCDTVRCTTVCLHHVPSWLLCIQIIHCYMYFTL